MNLTTDSLTSVVRRVHNQTGEANPHRLAEKILAELPETMFRAALEVTLADFVRRIITRPSPLPELPKSMPKTGRDYAALVRRRAHAWLSQSAFGADGWKPLADFTIADCEAASVERREQAAENVARAEWFERVGQAVAAAGVPTVGDLPDDVLAEVKP